MTVVSGCHATRPLPLSPPNPDAVVWHYEVTSSDPKVQSLSVEARFARGASDALQVDSAAAPYVRDVDAATIAAVCRGAWLLPLDVYPLYCIQDILG